MTPDNPNVYKLPLPGVNEEVAKWEQVEGVLMLSPQERQNINSIMCENLKMNGVEVGEDDSTIGEHALRTDSIEAALGITVISFAAYGRDGDIGVAPHPEKPEVLYFYSEKFQQAQLAAESFRLLHLTDMLLKIVDSPFRILKES